MTRREDGMSLVEVLLVMTLMLIVLGATLTTFNQFERKARDNQNLNEAQDSARRGLDLLARDLRNLASPTPLLPYAIDRFEPQDVIFQSEGKVKPPGSFNAQNTTRVRYCLNTTTKLLYRQIQTWLTAAPPAVPASACGSSGGWDTTMVVATDVTNAARPVFTYNATDFDKITEVSSQVFVDTTPTRLPAEVDLQSTVFLRNQNRAPTAVFSATSMPGGGIFLNASESEDPEEKSLTFEWWDASLTPVKKVGEGIVFTYSPPEAGMRQMYLVVKDATLQTTSDTKTVCAIGPGVTCP
ncbi:MAG TPA: prepilin-type N-terminal cleavage/methylation domain-containing protein [Thermoleophilaceae bacterium]